MKLKSMVLFAGLLASGAFAQSNFAVHVNGLQGVGVEYEQGFAPGMAASVQASYLPPVFAFVGLYQVYSVGAGIKYFTNPDLSGLFGAVYLNGVWQDTSRGRNLSPTLQLHVGGRLKLFDAVGLNLEGGTRAVYWNDGNQNLEFYPSVKLGVHIYL